MNTVDDTSPVPVESIELTRVEGDPCATAQHFTTFSQATEWLAAQAETFPKNGCHRIEFSVHWRSGDYCSGRFNARHPDNPLFIDFDIGRQIRRQAEFLVNAVSYHFAGQRRFETAERILEGELRLTDPAAIHHHAA